MRSKQASTYLIRRRTETEVRAEPFANPRKRLGAVQVVTDAERTRLMDRMRVRTREVIA